MQLIMRSPTSGKKNPRTTPKQVQVQVKHAVKASAGRRDELAMKQITVLIVRNKRIPAGHRNKRTIVDIVNDTKQMFLPRQLHSMLEIAPLRSGPLGQFEKRVWVALKGAYIDVTYLKLEQAASKKQSSIKRRPLLINGCVNKAGFCKGTRRPYKTALGDPYPPHFQLKTLAQTVGGQRMSVDWFANTKNAPLVIMR
jgi:hypothetical protein